MARTSTERSRECRARKSEKQKEERNRKERERYAQSGTIRKRKTENQKRRRVEEREKRLVAQPTVISRKNRDKWLRTRTIRSFIILHELRRRYGNDEFLKPYGNIRMERWLKVYRSLQSWADRTKSRTKYWREMKKEKALFKTAFKSQNFQVHCEDFGALLAMLQKNKKSHIKDSLMKGHKICNTGRSIRSVCKQLLVAACERLVTQLGKGVWHPPGTLCHQKVHRLICRIPYHVVKRDEEGAEPLSTLYPKLYRKFMGLPEESDICESDEQRDIAVNYIMEKIISDVIAGNATENISEEPAPDAEKADLGYGDEILDIEYGHDEDTAAAVGEDILGQNEEMRDAAGPLGPHLAARITFARECNNDCDPPMTTGQAGNFRKALLDFVATCKDGYYRKALQDTEPKVLPALNKHAACYSGVRSIRARFYAIRALLGTILRVEKSMHSADSSLLDSQVEREWKWLPSAVRKQVEAIFYGEENTKHHNLAHALHKFKTLVTEFHKKISQLETEVCQVCMRYREPEQMHHSTAYDMNRYLRDELRSERLSICKACMFDARKSKNPVEPGLPRYARSNGVDFDPVPPQLQGLNWIEKTLVQLVRPVRSIVCLEDAGGRSTSMRATTGAMVLLPVPTEGTFDHVAETLPSDFNMRIFVTPQSEKLKLIQINSSFQFSPDSVHIVKSDAPPTPEQFNDLLTHDEADPSLLQHIDGQIIRPMHGKQADGIAYEQYLLQQQRYETFSIDDKNLDVRAFPWHFPLGKLGYSDERGGFGNMQLRAMVRWWLCCKDRRIARDPQALSFLHGLLEQKSLTSSLGTQTRLSRQQLNVGDFEAAIEAGGSEIEVGDRTKESSVVLKVIFPFHFHSAARNIRGHVVYWDEVTHRYMTHDICGHQAKKNLRSHIATFGPPTFFLTLNPAEKDWDQMLEVYQLVYGKAVTPNNVFNYISADPLFFARIFQQRLRAMFYKMLLRGEGPLGKICHFFIRIEYQHRGTEHAHCLLWVEGAPDVNASDDERLAFIDRYITARLPNNKKEAELHAIISQHQKHYESHSQTCLRTYKAFGKRMQRCRFDFPRPVQMKTVANKYSVEMMGIPGARIKPYYLARRPCDVFVNDYNPLISLLWKANTDLQYVWGGMADIVTYIAGYTTKNEKSKEAVSANEALKSATNSKEGFKALLTCVRMRHSGMLEVIDTLNGHSLHQFEADHIFINTNKPDKRDRMLKGKAQIDRERKSDSSARAYRDNLIDVYYYPGRSELLEDFCIFYIAIQFKVIKGCASDARTKRRVGAKDDEEEEDAHSDNDADEDNDRTFFQGLYHTSERQSPFYNHGRNASRFDIIGCTPSKVFELLNHPLVPRIFWPNLESGNDESREDYYRRPSEDDIINESDTYENFWLAWIADFEQRSPDGASDIRRVIAHQEALPAQDRETTEKRKAARELLNALQVDEDPEDGVEMFDRNVDEEVHKRRVSKMNDGQRKVYEDVLKHLVVEDAYRRSKKGIMDNAELSVQERNVALRALGNGPDPLLKVVMGTAGCGESYVINSLADQITIDYVSNSGTRTSRPSVLLAAPTGLAAVQIHGSTLHTLLGINVQRGRDVAMRELKPAKKEALRLQFTNVRLLIIDELSMLSAVGLAKVHLRLQLNRLFGSMLPSMNLFDHFSYHELTENMRQSGDLRFGELLQRLRIQRLSDEDVEILKTRVVSTSDEQSLLDAAAELYVSKMNESTDPPMALFPKNYQVRDFNKLIIENLQLEIVIVPAEDSISRNTRRMTPDGRTRDCFGRPYQEAELDVGKEPGSTKKKKQRTEGEEKEKEEMHGNREAGLEKKLILAENGRVMLRRNIDAPRGFVNGATGVLKRFEKTADGEVVLLRVDFDNIGEVALEKVSATFDSSPEQKTTRRQFPLMMALRSWISSSICSSCKKQREIFSKLSPKDNISFSQSSTQFRILSTHSKRFPCHLDVWNEKKSHGRVEREENHFIFSVYDIQRQEFVREQSLCLRGSCQTLKAIHIEMYNETALKTELHNMEGKFERIDNDILRLILPRLEVETIRLNQIEEDKEEMKILIGRTFKIVCKLGVTLNIK